MSHPFTALTDDPKAQRIIQALKDYETRFIGGCVRDILMNRPVGDIDMATTATPEEMKSAFNAAGISVIPTGIEHGTLTALIDKTPYEITTLRSDVTTDGRRATVAFSKDWAHDAERRDFTINALSVDGDGQLYDYFGGQNDIATETLRFIGNTAQRIREDYLRILRFFRFASQFNWDVGQSPDIQPCIELAPNLKSLSRERVQSELFKTLLGAGAEQIIKLMIDHKILVQLIATPLDLTRFQKTLSQSSEAFRRLIALAGYQAPLDKFIVLSREQKKRLESLEKLEGSNWKIEKILYFYGTETARDYQVIFHPDTEFPSIASWQRPVFPLKAEEIINQFGLNGVALGDALKKAEMHWVDHEFKPTKQELLDLIG